VKDLYVSNEVGMEEVERMFGEVRRENVEFFDSRDGR
jgi:hypothetical protein